MQVANRSSVGRVRLLAVAPSGMRVMGLVFPAALVQCFAVGFVLHRLHDDPAEAHEAVYIGPTAHWLRDSALSFPLALILLLLATLGARRLVAARGHAPDGVGAHLLWAGLGAVAYAVASVPAALAHTALFAAGHEERSFLFHSVEEAVVTLRYSFALLLAFALVVGLPLTARSPAAASAPVDGPRDPKASKEAQWL